MKTLKAYLIPVIITLMAIKLLVSGISYIYDGKIIGGVVIIIINTLTLNYSYLYFKNKGF